MRTGGYIKQGKGKIMSLYRQIADELIERVRTGVYPVGSELPTLAALCEEYGIGRVTAQNVLRIVMEAGYASVSRGRKSTALLPGENTAFFHGKNITLRYHSETLGRVPLLMRLLLRLQQDLLGNGNRALLHPGCPDAGVGDSDLGDGCILIDVTDCPEHCRERLEHRALPWSAISMLNDGILRPHQVHLFLNHALLQAVAAALEMRMKRFIFLGISGSDLNLETVLAEPPPTEPLPRAVATYLNPAVRTLLAHRVRREAIEVRNCASDPAKAEALVEQMLLDGLGPGCAFIVGTDHIAMGVCRALLARSWRPQRDFCVSGGSGLPEAASFIPAISNFNTKIGELSAAAIDLLRRQFDPAQPPVCGRLIEAELQLRET